MEDRKKYVEKMQHALAELEVKASLAKLELGDKKDDLIERYDKLHDDLRTLKTDTSQQWYALQEGFESGWKAFRKEYGEVMKRFRGP
jgi:thiamine kinase-like enzyme